MYRLISPQVIVENILVLTKPFQETNQITPTSLKQAYRKFLHSFQPHCPYLLDETLFHADSQVEAAFADFFSNEQVEFKNPKLAVDVNHVMYPDATIRKNILETSLNHTATMDPTFADLFRLVMNTVFCTVSKNLGGTSVNQRYIGVMCAHYDLNAEIPAIPELLLHEFTHQALFLDELRYQHFNYDLMNDPKTHADIHYEGHYFKISAHRCLHSLIVAAEVLLARDAYIGHAPYVSQHLISTELLNRAQIYLAALKNNIYTNQVLTARGKELLQYCENFYLNYII